MTVEAIARRTTIPIDIIRTGITKLSEPDKHSRTPAEEGRRIVPLSADRDWGWKVVNYKHYRDMKREEDRREYHRQYWHKRRLRSGDTQQTQQDSTASTKSTEEVSSRKEVVTTLSGKPDVDPLPKLNGRAVEAEILEYLNRKAGKAYKPVAANISLITARLRGGASPEDLKAVIDRKCAQWLSDAKMAQYLRPATLFNATKFAQYQGETDQRDSHRNPDGSIKVAL